MDWLERVFNLPSNKKNELSSASIRDISLTNINIVSKISDITPTAQFFLGPYYSEKNILTPIPAHYESTRMVLLREIAPHFNKTTEIKHIASNRIFMYNLIDVNTNSLAAFCELLEQNQLQQLIKDIYFTSYGNPLLNEREEKQLAYYKLLTNSFPVVSSETFNETWKFLHDTYLEYQGYLAIRPTNWFKSEELANSPMLAYLNKKWNDIYLAINETSNKVEYIILG